MITRRSIEVALLMIAYVSTNEPFQHLNQFTFHKPMTKDVAVLYTVMLQMLQ